MSWDPLDDRAYYERKYFEERRRREEEEYYRMIRPMTYFAGSTFSPIPIEEKEPCKSCGTSHKDTKLDENGRCTITQKKHLENLHKVASARGTHP